MIVHQAERTARTIPHGHTPAAPDTGIDPAAEPAHDTAEEARADAALADVLPLLPAPAGFPVRDESVREMPARDATVHRIAPGGSIHVPAASGLGAVLDDERRHWWPPTALRSRYDRAAGHGGGRWPAPVSDEPRLGRQVLRADPASPRLAREFTRNTLTEWRLGHLTDEALLVVSELVTNALCHGLEGVALTAQQCPVQLVLLGHRRRLVTVITDPGSALPVRRPQGASAESGRGLWVVDAISAAWGWTPLASGGKAVWAALPITPAAGAPRREGR